MAKLEEVADKLEQSIELTEEEIKSLNAGFRDYRLKVDNAIYSNNDVKGIDLSVYERIAKYYLKNVSKNTAESLRFLQYYFIYDTCRELELKIIVRVDGEKEHFINNPKSNAFHGTDNSTGRTKIAFNPFLFEKIVSKLKDPKVSEDEKVISVYSLINTSFHELEHEYQDAQIRKNGISNPQALIWAKEFLTRQVVGSDFYKSNYDNIFHERDARNYASLKTQKIFNKYYDPDLTLNFNDDSSYRLDIQFEDVTTNTTKVAIDLLDGVATESIKADSKLLYKYPVLRTIYTENGKKKLLPQIQSELEVRKLEELSKNPDKEQEIEEKYSKLLSGIIETDHDLQLQSLCQELSKSGLEGRDYMIKVAEINQLMDSVNLSYDDVLYRISTRLHQLEKETDRSKIQEELNGIKLLKKCMLEYVTKFRDKHQNEMVIIDTKKELDDKFGIKIDKYNYTLGQSEVIMTTKNLDELDNDFFDNMERIKQSGMDKSQIGLYISKLRKVYEIYKQDYMDSSLYKEEDLRKKQEQEAQAIVDQMANGGFDNTKELDNKKQMGYVKVWILGVITFIISIGIIVLGMILSK